jgi:hypothetical protein
MSIDTQIKLYFKTQAQSFIEAYPPLVKEETSFSSIIDKLVEILDRSIKIFIMPTI